MANTNFGVSFRGKRIVHPGAYDYIDASQSTIKATNSYNIPIVIGEADTGKPGELVWISDVEQARQYLSGGELLTAVEMMFSPVPEGAGGASLIGVIVANENTKAELDIGGMKIYSTEYGKFGNNIQVKVEKGTIEGTHRLTAYRWDNGINEIYDNLGAVMSLQYTGEEPYAAMTVEKEGESTRLAIYIGEDKESAALDLKLELGDERFNTITKLVNFFSSNSGYRASFLKAGNEQVSSSSIDVVTDKNIKETTYLNSLEEDIDSTINMYSSLIKIAEVKDITEEPRFTYLQGGTTGVAPLSWVPHLEACKNTFSDILVLLSGDESIHAQGLAHIEEMERRGHRQIVITGGGTDETPSHAIRRAKMLNHSRAVSVYPGVYHRAAGGGKKPLPAYMSGALVAGRLCGVDPAEPITFDYISAGGLTKELIVGDPIIDDLLRGGVCTFESVQNGGIRIVQGLTTYTNLNNPVYREISVRRGADYIASSVRQKLEETFIGKKGLASTETSVETVVIDMLDKAVKDELIVAYNPDSIVVRFVDSVVYVDYMVAPVTPINFILITSRFVPSNLI